MKKIIFFIAIFLLCSTLVHADTFKPVNVTSSYQTNILATTTNTTVTGMDIPAEHMSCRDLLGDNLRKVLHLFINAVRIFGAIAAIITAMLALVPAIASDDAGALKKATRKCIYIFVILVFIGIFPTIVGIIGKLAGLDLTCLVK